MIVERDGQFLVGKCMLTDDLKWSNSPYDAWKTRDIPKAYMVAHAVRGRKMLFNPVVNQLREAKI